MLKRIVVGAGLAAIGCATYASLRRWQLTWGVVPGEAERLLPGDDLVPNARSSDTRGISIDAPPELVWPWLLQMGFGRGGWYSYDQLDMRGRSAATINDEWQGLAVGDVVPTHPGGGFAVKHLDPGRALVLYADSTTMQPLGTAGGDQVPAGLAASGALLSATPAEFAASWAFVLEPLGERRTRLLERVRYWGAEGNPMATRMLSVFGFGVFVMVQRQMTGIRSRAERLARERGPEPRDTGRTGNGKATAPELGDTVLATAAPD
jgi:hypothetical protein